jgi:SAM-dependent methyltransferase
MSRRDMWDERYAAKELVWSAGPNRLLADELTGLQPGTALDVACGEGRNALWLAEQGWEVTGIDFSEVAIGKARQIAERRGVTVDWLVADIAEHDLGPSTFDLVCVLYLHTGPEERARWLPKTISAVKPGGTWLYIGHDPSNIEHGVGGPQDAALLPGAQDLSRALHGFRIDRAEIVERRVDADPGHGRDLGDGIALDAFVRAVRQAS